MRALRRPAAARRPPLLSAPPWAGLAATALGLGVGELAASTSAGTHSPVTGTGRALIDRTPGPFVDVTVALFEGKDKALLTAGVIGLQAGAGVAAGWLESRQRGWGAALQGLTGVGTGALAAARPEAATRESLAAGLAGAAAGACAVTTLAAHPRPGAFAGVLGLAAAAGLAGRRRSARLRTQVRERQRSVPIHAAAPPATAHEEPGFELPGLTPAFTPNDRFYVTDVTLPPPAVEPDRWRLRVTGLVEHPLELSLDDLLGLGLEELDATLVCVHNPVGGGRLGTARWAGVPVRSLLARAGVRPGADQLLARSVDGFSAGVPLALLAEDRPALVALAMNGEPLPLEHGHPARLLVPGLWGQDANTKWLSELELTTFAAVSDYWDRRGWPRNPSPVSPGSRIDVPADLSRIAPGPETVAGVAWAPPHGVAGVEVAVDGGPWQSARLSRELAPTAWRRWRLDWEATAGRHDFLVRTVARTASPGSESAPGVVGGFSLQGERDAPPFPGGSSGLHRVRVLVSSPSARRVPGRGLRRAGSRTAARIELATAGAAAWSRGGRPERG